MMVHLSHSLNPIPRYEENLVRIRAGRVSVLDLEEVKLVNQDVVTFLGHCAAR
jgi:hypothetical protein